MTAYLRAPGAGARVDEVIFSREGDASVEQGEWRWYADSDKELLGVVCSAGEAPGGQPLIFDVELDAFDGGASCYAAPGDLPTIAAGAHLGSTGAPSATTLVPEGHYLTVDIVQAGTSPAGSKIVVQIQTRDA